MLTLSLIRYTWKSLSIAPISLLTSRQNSLQLIPPPLHLGKVKTLTIGNRGSIYCVVCNLVYSAVIYYLNYANL